MAILSIQEVFSQIKSREALLYDSDEDIGDIEDTVIAFSEMVTESPFTEDKVWWDVLLILSVFDYLKPEFEHQYGLNPIFPKPKDIRDYIKSRRKQIIKDVRSKPNRRTGVKARVRAEEFKKLRDGQSITPLAVFAFFGDDRPE